MENANEIYRAVSEWLQRPRAGAALGERVAREAAVRAHLEVVPGRGRAWHYAPISAERAQRYILNI